MVQRALIGAALATLALATPARAGTVSAVNNDPQPSDLYYAGAADGIGAKDQLTVDIGSGNSWFFSVIYPTTIAPSAGDHSGACTVNQSLISVNCHAILSPLRKITYDLGPGDDTVTLKYSTGPRVVFMGGEGNDTLTTTGNTSAISANGDAGDDQLLGNSAQQDMLDGGDGNDTFGALRGPDIVIGGPDTDLLDFASAEPLFITLDGRDNDGVENQGANVSVENVFGGSLNDQLQGDPGPNLLDGRAGNDLIIGLGGADTLVGNIGDDTINARDGAADTIDCGLGNDTAIADVADATIGCETVQLPDIDGDGVSAATDCDDSRVDIHPGAIDTPDDGLDQNCDGADAHVVPAPPPPSVAISTAAFGTPRWSLSRVRGNLTFAMTASHPAHVTVTLVQGSRTLLTKILDLPAGRTERKFSLPKTLPPGSYVLKLTGTAGGVTVSGERALALAAPPEGVVTRAVMSTRRNGPGVAQISKAKQLFATFRFAPQGLPKKKIKAYWSRNGKRVDAFTALAPNAFSYYANPHGLKRGLWTCELRMGKTVIARVRTRIG